MPQSDKATFPENLVDEIKALIPHYPDQEAALIPALHLVQERFNYISERSIVELSEILEIAPAHIMATLSFYTMFRTEPSGRFHISVCKNLSCSLTGSRDILSYLEKKLGITIGETTDDKAFSLGAVECLGACSEAPVMEIDCEYFFHLTPEKVDQIIDDYRGKIQG